MKSVVLFILLKLRSPSSPLASVEVDGTAVVDVATGVFLLGLLVIDDPIVAICNILVEVLLAWLKVNHDEPLVCEVVERHVVAHLPVVERSTELHLIEFRTVVRECKRVACSYFFWVLDLVKCRIHIIEIVKVLIIVWIILLVIVGSKINLFELLLFVLICPEYLLDDADWLVVRRMPRLELLLQLLNDLLVEELFTFESIELVEPCLAHYFSTHCRLKCILSKLQVLLFISESAKSSLHCSSQISRIVAFKCET